jgi:hypothetical protein
MSCRETPGSIACVDIASAHSTLDEAQVFAVLQAGVAEAHQFGLRASEEEYHEHLSGFQRQLSEDPTSFGGRSRGMEERLAVGLVEWQPDPGRRYALVSLQDRVTMAERHLSGLLGRWSVALREGTEVSMRRYDAYRAEAQLNRNCRAPGDFARGLVSAPLTWAAPRDRVTTWALYRLAQDAGVEPRPGSPAADGSRVGHLPGHLRLVPPQ